MFNGTLCRERRVQDENWDRRRQPAIHSVVKAWRVLGIQSMARVLEASEEEMNEHAVSQHHATWRLSHTAPP
jgi:hypothetical protein